MKQEKSIIGIYHKDCIDGTAAAAVLLKKFPNARLFPLHHSYTAADIDKIREAAGTSGEIYAVDCAMAVKELLADGHNVTIIDHHEGIKDELRELAERNKRLKFVYDNEKSGASLAWSYFFGDEETPWIIKYVEDGDLWRWRYGEDTKYVNSCVSMHINSPESIVIFFDGEISELKRKGKIISDYADLQIKKMVDNTKNILLKIGRFSVPVYNIGMYESQAGNQLAENQGMTVALFTIKGDNVKFSFRGMDGHSPSALELARALKGGGHKNAAGAEISLHEFIGLIINPS